MLQLLPGCVLFVFCIYSFCREVKLDRVRYLERDRLGDEHILREIDKYMREQRSEEQSIPEVNS